MSINGRATTESRLREWRYGQAQAERLAAAILHLEGFTDIDPQAPLGGPDDRKDILCTKSDKKYIGAAYFPTKEKIFSEVEGKFEHDLEGVRRHNRQGLVFITNQTISLKDRSQLENIAINIGIIPILYHQERIRVILDSPVGYGVRLEFLRIPMDESEQLAYFASESNKLEYALERQTREISMLSRRIKLLEIEQKHTASTIFQIATRFGEKVSLPSDFAEISDSLLLDPDGAVGPISAEYTPSLLLFVHRIVCNEMPFSIIGKFRDRTVWLGPPGATEKEAVLVPPAPDEIPGRLRELLSSWNQEFQILQSEGRTEKLEKIAQFHQRLLALHPFTDGNGRVARTLLLQQCIDLFGHVDPVLIDSGKEYYGALQDADRGDFEKLRELISNILS